MTETTMDSSRRRALKVLGAAGVLGASGCATTGPASTDRPVLMDGHVHITNRIYCNWSG
jgi:hypothetical protein